MMASVVEALVFMLRSVWLCAGANFAGSFIFLEWVCEALIFHGPLASGLFS
jgi:hypothetical protein